MQLRALHNNEHAASCRRTMQDCTDNVTRRDRRFRAGDIADAILQSHFLRPRDARKKGLRIGTDRTHPESRSRTYVTHGSGTFRPPQRQPDARVHSVHNVTLHSLRSQERYFEAIAARRFASTKAAAHACATANIRSLFQIVSALSNRAVPLTIFARRCARVCVHYACTRLAFP